MKACDDKFVTDTETSHDGMNDQSLPFYFIFLCLLLTVLPNLFVLLTAKKYFWCYLFVSQLDQRS